MVADVVRFESYAVADGALNPDVPGGDQRRLDVVRENIREGAGSVGDFWREGLQWRQGLILNLSARTEAGVAITVASVTVAPEASSAVPLIVAV